MRKKKEKKKTLRVLTKI